MGEEAAVQVIRVPRFVRIFGPVTRWLLRAGLPMGPNALLTVKGRRSGQPRTTPVAVFEADGRRWTQSAFGEVQWVRNLRAARRAVLQTGRKTEFVSARELSKEQATDVFAHILAPQIRGYPVPLRWLLPSMLGIRDIIDDPAAAAQRHPVFELRSES